MKQFCVLVVDDEPRIVKFLNVKLRTSGYEVITASSGEEALELVLMQEPDLVVLDVVMPGIDGLETLKQIRSISSLPVIILSAKGENLDKISGLKLGADDYLTKPFNPDELVARIEAISRRLKPDEDRRMLDEITLGDLAIDFNRRVAKLDGKDTQLTRLEWLLLSELSRNIGNLMIYEDLLSRIWGPEYRNDVQILRTWVSRLRKKIEKDPANPKLIRTVAKTGYIMENPAS